LSTPHLCTNTRALVTIPLLSLPTCAPQGLKKLQLISDAKRLCPDVVIVLGEDLARFRNASKELYSLLRSFSWNARCERLGFDEVRLCT
jgi:nucleotidyltransferase/DNA polymerase involved in DNA repair